MQKTIGWIAVASLALVVAGCNPAQQQQANRSGATIERKGREMFNKAATTTQNAALAGKVKEALNLRQGLSTKRIEVNADAKTGAVTLEGSVPDMQQRKVAEDVARSTDGVHSVTNQLAVPPTTSAQR